MIEIITIPGFQEILGPVEVGRLLDIASGSGQFIGILTGSLGNWEHITGLDLSDEILEETRKKYIGDKFSFVTGSALDLPFESESFDMVCISKGLHHVPDPAAALSEMIRVVKAGGYVLVSETCSDGLDAAQGSQKMHHHLRVEVDRLLGNSHNFTFTRKELFDIMDKVPLQDLKVYEYTEPVKDPFNKEMVHEYRKKMQYWINELRDHPEREHIKQKMMKVEEKISKDGIARPPLLIFMGRKSANAGQ